MSADTDTPLATLTSSHDRLVTAVKPLSPEQLADPDRCGLVTHQLWTVADTEPGPQPA